MKHDKFWQGLWAGVLALCLGVGSLGCMVSGLEIMTAGEFFPVILLCLLGAALFSALCSFRLAPLAGLVLLAGLAYSWVHGSLEASAARLALDISSIYNSGYGWGVLVWTDAPGAGSQLPAMAALALALIFPVCWTVCRRQTAWIAFPLTLPPLASTLLLTDTVPQTGYLLIYFFGLILLLLSQGVRRRDIRQGNRLCLQAAVPVALALALIFLLNPQSSYNKQALADKLEQGVTRLVERLTLPQDSPPNPTDSGRLPVLGDTSDTVNLENAGPKSQQNQWVMTVDSDRDGFLYLRGASFASYDGRTWRIGSQEEETAQWPQLPNDLPTGQLTITTRGLHSVLYLPYYSSQLLTVNDGRCFNASDRKVYHTSYWVLEGQDPSGAAWQVDEAYTQLPRQTRQWAEGVVRGLLGSASVPEDPQRIHTAAQKIGQYVTESAVYSLQTPRMPEEEEDFVRWFLEQSETGYCIHFASSAAVLLRAAGIPARYVTGYVVDARADQTNYVYIKNAHAWVEYYVPGQGWSLLEATPAAGQEELPLPTTPPATAGEDPASPTETAAPPDTPTAPGTSPPDSTKPVVTTPGDTLPPKDADDDSQTPPAEPADLRWLLWPLLACALVLAQRWIRLGMRRQWLHTGRGNRRALVYWREVERLARILGEEPPETLLALAQKAKFSQHTLDREELQQLKTYLQQAELRLRRHPWYQQLLYRLVYALY